MGNWRCRLLGHLNRRTNLTVCDRWEYDYCDRDGCRHRERVHE